LNAGHFHVKSSSIKRNGRHFVSQTQRHSDQNAQHSGQSPCASQSIKKNYKIFHEMKEKNDGKKVGFFGHKKENDAV
jgi:hypothetical protein